MGKQDFGVRGRHESWVFIYHVDSGRLHLFESHLVCKLSKDTSVYFIDFMKYFVFYLCIRIDLFFYSFHRLASNTGECEYY